ncbi:MAG: thioredoxin-disulfide reductase [Candidatus Woykebacteria bacterium RBG_13_40_15]|uniref:Thioredoxin reductase n=1 Tax=Candidatus Woykebacteria bacterium RBG_13_40_15 TaxID=1802593 RepID=A0A1G1W6A7_9BACT|nr:MAG: thioredoxin-disulfide reductase [Candidatus Woykebacteria bacterium RBG_13_40_15]
MENKTFDIIIIGGGPAGLTAAIYAARSDLDFIVFEGSKPGGQITMAPKVEDFPGFPGGISGAELMVKTKKQAEILGAKIVCEEAIKVDLSGRPFKVFTKEKEYKSKSLIVATGSAANWLGLESEQRLIGQGVSACSICDGPFFKGKKVAIVGGGDTATKEATYLSKIASEVVLIHRGSGLDAFAQNQDRVFETKNIKVIFDSVVEEILGESKVEGVKIRNLKSQKEEDLRIDGLFIAIGHNPATGFLKGQVELDNKGFIVVRDQTKTSVPGVFAAGDAMDSRYQQAITAAAAGCKAALDAESWLEEY